MSAILGKIKDYTHLARLHQPAGFLLLMWPCWFGLALAVRTTGQTIDQNVIIWLCLYLVGSIFLRSSGCIINDIWDRKIDAKVQRTKNRPLAAGRISVLGAIVFCIILLLFGFLIFLQLNSTAQFISLTALIFAILYPLMKRFFLFPQLFLGITFNLGVLIAYSNLMGFLDFPIFISYLGCVFWTLGYDTIYGNQDKLDDNKIGVKSTALTFGEYNKIIILASYVIFISALIYCGFMLNLINIYITIIPTLAYLLYQVKVVDLDNSKDCMEKFKQNAYIVGLLVFAAITFS